MISYFKATKDDIPSLKNIFSSCFGENEENTNIYFENLLNYKYCYVAKENTQVCASLYLLPTKTYIDNLEYKSHYLFGAGTKEEYRKRGIMENLIDFSLEDAKNNGDDFSILYPATDSLYNYYSKFGYQNFYKSKTLTLTYEQIKNFKCTKLKKAQCSFDFISNLRFNIVKRLNGSMHFDSDYIEKSTPILNMYGGGIICFESGYIAYYKSYEDVIVQEIICNPEDFKQVMFSFSKEIKAQNYLLRLPLTYDTFNFETLICDFGMIKRLNNSIKLESETLKKPYLGFTLD